MAKTPDYTKKAVKDYQNKFDLVQVRFPKGTKERLQKLTNASVNNYIVDAVLVSIESDEDLLKDSGLTLEEYYTQEEEEQDNETEPPPEPQQEQLFADVQGFKVPAHIGENGQIQVYAEDLPRLQLKPGKKKNFNIA